MIHQGVTFARPNSHLFLSLIAILALAFVAAAQNQCDARSSKCAPEAPTVEEDQHDMPDDPKVKAKYLFSTPLLQTHISAFVSNVTAFNKALAEVVIDDYEDFLKSNNEAKAEFRNDDFFVYQQGDNDVMTDDEIDAVLARAAKMRFRNTPEFKTLNSAVSALAGSAVRNVLQKQVAGDHTDHDVEDEDPIEIYSFEAWAAVHYKRAKHALHFHEGSALSAVYYVSVPNGSGELTLYDPRGPRPPFELTFTLHPKEGDLIMFPGWLGHSVGQTGNTGRIPRISIPFNGEGTWEQTSHVPPAEWEVPPFDIEHEDAATENIAE